MVQNKKGCFIWQENGVHLVWVDINKFAEPFSLCKATSPEGVFRQWQKGYKGTPRCSYPHLALGMAVQSFLQYVGSSPLLCLAAGLFALLYFLSSSKKSVCNLPPGPRPLPLIGNLNVVDLKKPFQSLTEVRAEQAGRGQMCNSWNEKHSWENRDVVVFALCGGQQWEMWHTGRLAEWLYLQRCTHTLLYLYI